MDFLGENRDALFETTIDVWEEFVQERNVALKVTPHFHQLWNLRILE